MGRDLLEPVERCPICGASLPESATYDGCARCAAPVTRTSFILRTDRPDGRVDGVLMAIWLIPLTTALAVGAVEFAIVIALLLLLHIGYAATRTRLARDRAPRERLLITHEGIGPCRSNTPFEVRPYHLFEQVRLEAADQLTHNEEQNRWRLTIVNAYKPTISTFLHSRGTDAAIFCESIDVTFEAAEPDAIDLQALLQDRIDAARAAYRATRLREENERKAMQRRFRQRLSCHICGASAWGNDSPDQCDACGAFICFDPQRPRFVLDAEGVTWNPVIGLGTIAMALISLWPLLHGDLTAALLWLTGPLLYVLWRIIDRTWREGKPVRQWVVTPEGLERYAGARCEHRFTWHDLPICRFVGLERGSWRLALWNDRGLRISFSSLLFSWLSLPISRPIIDVVLNDVDLAGRLICEEIARRHATELGENAAACVVTSS